MSKILINNIPSLDGIRAVSVFIVMLAHAGLGNIIPGGLGVTIFFFLSGYLITTLLAAEFKKTGTVNIFNFYVRRFFRLGPPLLITLLISYGAVLMGWHPGAATFEGFLAQMFYLANYYMLFFDGASHVPLGTGVLWSLAVEEHFYLVYPLAFAFAARHWEFQRMALGFILVSLAVLAWRIFLVDQPGFSFERTYYATDTRIDSILWGCVAALVFNPVHAGHYFDAKRHRRILLMAAGLGGLVLSLLVRDAWLRETLRYTLQGLSLMALFYCAIRYHDRAIFRPLNWAWVKRMGVYSYAIYLIHHVVVRNLAEYMSWGNKVLPVLLVTLLVSVAYAAAIEHFVESRMRRLRARYR